MQIRIRENICNLPRNNEVMKLDSLYVIHLIQNLSVYISIYDRIYWLLTILSEDHLLYQLIVFFKISINLINNRLLCNPCYNVSKDITFSDKDPYPGDYRIGDPLVS